MGIIIPDNTVARVLAREKLEKHFSLYRKHHSVRSSNMGSDLKTWLEYDALDGDRSTAHFDLNFFWPNVCYLTYIEINQSLRGKGYGSQLYKTVEEIAKGLGCTRLCQTPEGTIVVNGEFRGTREDYLVRRGYKPVDLRQVEKMLNS